MLWTSLGRFHFPCTMASDLVQAFLEFLLHHTEQYFLAQFMEAFGIVKVILQDLAASIENLKLVLRLRLVLHLE